MHLRSTIIVICSLAVASSAFAASRKDHADCGGNDADRIIAGCTRIIEDKSESDADRGAAFMNRAHGWRLKEERNHAITDLDEAIRLNPNDALAYDARAINWLEKRELDKAIADYTEAIRINPRPRSDKAASGYLNIHAHRAVAWHQKDDLERALADYDEAIRLDANDADAWFRRGGVHLLKNDSDHAIEDLSTAVRLDPARSYAWYLRGRLHYAKYMADSEWIRKEDLDRAIEDFGEVIRREPGWPLGFHARGLAYRTKGDRERALNDLLVAVELNPHDPQVVAAVKELKPDFEVPKDPLEKLMKWDLPAAMKN